jgi:hypothetical protein
LRRKELHLLKLPDSFDLLKTPDCQIKMFCVLKEIDETVSKITLSNSEKSSSFKLAIKARRIEVELLDTEKNGKNH